ncbi:MAG: helix-turn-helix transcriptional regulator [Clostridia bacterium]|nr:helix-turn-helix transcriptional regulator [Clostridia bacterium]
MKESMGQIIRRLRKNADLTQEELAEHLGVTYQAVSRWENDTWMPDVSQIVPLANIFDIPIDVLFGRVGQNADKEVEEFEARMLEDDHDRDFTDDREFIRWRLDRTDQYRKMAELYPNNLSLLFGAMSEGLFAVTDYEEDNADLASVISPAEYRALLEECINWGDRIVRLEAGAKDLNYLYAAKQNQIAAYCRLGNKEKALEIARTLPKQQSDLYYRQAAEIAWMTGDREGEIKNRALTVFLLLEELDCQSVMLGHAYRDLGQYAAGRECYSFLRELEKAVYGEDAWSPPFVLDGPFMFGNPAACLVREKREEDAISFLEEYFDWAVRHAEAWNTRLNEPSSSPLLKPVPWTYNEKVRRSAKKELTEHILNVKAFESLRGNPRFDALVKKIEELPEE